MKKMKFYAKLDISQMPGADQDTSDKQTGNKPGDEPERKTTGAKDTG